MVLWDILFRIRVSLSDEECLEMEILEAKIGTSFSFERLCQTERVSDREEDDTTYRNHSWAWSVGKVVGKTILNKIVMITGMGDIHPRNPPPTFVAAETVFLPSNDKNFIYYWTYPRVFPVVNTIYLNSHPCEPPVMHRFNARGTIIHLDERYQCYKRRWAPDSEYVKLFRFEDIFGKEYSFGSPFERPIIPPPLHFVEEPLHFPSER